MKKKNLSIRKKSMFLFILLLVSLVTAGCSKISEVKDEATHYGVNAKIIWINSELKGFVVEGLDNDSVLGEKCYVGLEDESIELLYVDYETGKTHKIAYEDFAVGDEITLDINIDSVKNKYTVPFRVQLVTQKEAK